MSNSFPKKQKSLNDVRHNVHTRDHSYAIVNCNNLSVTEINQTQPHDHACASNSVGKDPHNSSPQNILNHDHCLSVSAEHTSNSFSKKRKSHKPLQSSPISNAHTNTSQSTRPLRKVRRVCSDNQTNERQFSKRNQISEENSTQCIKTCSSTNCIIPCRTYVPEEEFTYKICRKLGLPYEKPLHNETSYDT